MTDVVKLLGSVVVGLAIVAFLAAGSPLTWVHLGACLVVGAVIMVAVSLHYVPRPWGRADVVAVAYGAYAAGLFLMFLALAVAWATS